MDFNRRYFLRQISQASLAGIGISYAAGCAQDSEEALIIRLNVTQPVSGDSICIGESFPIRWQLSGQANLDIQLSKDNGTTWETIFTNIPGTQNEILWQAPTEPADNLLFRFLNASDQQVLHTTSAFRVTGPTLLLKSTFADETILTGQTIDIEWNATCLTTVKLEYSVSGGSKWTALANKIPAKDGKYSWTVPVIFTKLGKIRVVSEADANLNAASEGVFTILPQIKLDLNNYPDLAKVGGTIREELSYFGSVAIVRLTEDTFQVMNLTCTHQGCVLETATNGEIWYCPCHLANFTKNGCIITGEASRPLDQYKYEFDKTNNVIILTFESLPNQVCA